MDAAARFAEDGGRCATRGSGGSANELKSAASALAGSRLEGEPVRTGVGLEYAARVGVGAARVDQVTAATRGAPRCPAGVTLSSLVCRRRDVFGGESAVAPGPRCEAHPLPFAERHEARLLNGVGGCGKAPINGEHKMWGLTSRNAVFSQIGPGMAGNSFSAMDALVSGGCVASPGGPERSGGAAKRLDATQPPDIQPDILWFPPLVVRHLYADLRRR